MSMLPFWDKELTPCRVKAQERHDVDITKLVQHGAHRINPQQPVYADLTDIPRDRGEARREILDLANRINRDDLLEALFTMPQPQAFAYIKHLRAQATKRNEPNDAKRAGSATTPPPETPKA